MTPSRLETAAEPGATALLVATDLVVRHGRIQVVHGVSLSVAEGTVTCLIGANGAGKSTLLRTLVGLHRAAAGSVVFAGTPIHRLAAHEVARRGIVIVPEGRHVFPSLSVIDNLRMGGVPRRARWRSPDGLGEVLELFPVLDEYRDRQAGLLSGGQQQMLAMGRALMAQPRLMVLDEPSMGLAPVVVDRIFEALVALKERGTTILLAEQNARLALRLADQAYVLETGRVVESGPAAELRGSARVERIYLGG